MRKSSAFDTRIRFFVAVLLIMSCLLPSCVKVDHPDDVTTSEESVTDTHQNGAEITDTDTNDTTQTTTETSDTEQNNNGSTDTDMNNTDINNTTPAPKRIFDEDNIILSFGAISDIHITGKITDNSESKFREAITQLRAQAAKHDANGLDAIAIAGDMTQNGTADEVNTFVSVINDMGVKNVMLTPGNHDIRNSTGFLDGYLSTMGESHIQNDVDQSMLEKGARHCVVNGSHFIFIEPTSYSNDCPYDASVMSWLNTTLTEITKNDPNAYVFVFTHPMPYDTCYGSTLSGGCWYTTHLTNTLSKYPQVVTFGGHLHFAINDERSIMQTEFTSVGCGSVRYLATERGFSNMASATVPKDAHSVSSGLLVQVDSAGNVRITRMDFSNDSTFKEPWELSAPDSDKTHLTKYTKRRNETNQAPSLTGTPTLDVVIAPSTGTVTDANLTIPAGTDDDFVHHYKVVIKNLNTTASSTFQFLSDFYRHPQTSDMAKELTFPLDIFESGSYLIEVSAVDSWDAESKKISCEVTVGDTAGGLSSVLPNVYTDFEFVNGTISDTNNKFTVDVQGASVKDVSLTFAGTTKTVSAFRVLAKGQHATLRFKDYTASTMTNFYNSSTGFTIETLYVNYDPSGKQGVVCGTQKAGLGLAENVGKPYFFTYTTSGSAQINASSDVAVSKTELNHEVCTGYYNEAQNKTYTAMYVNGELLASGSCDGKIKISTNADIATALCLGADIAISGKGDDFQTTNFALADVKIYATALNYKQVGTAYQNAIDNFKNS